MNADALIVTMFLLAGSAVTVLAFWPTERRKKTRPLEPPTSYVKVPTVKDNADEFVRAALADAATCNVWVIMYQSKWPYMGNASWRDYVAARLETTGLFKEVKFSEPCALDSDWVFTASPKTTPKSQRDLGDPA